MFSQLKNVIKRSDFFYSTEMLRYEEQQEYRTITGGLLSLGIIITTCIGFASMVLQTLDLSSITTQVQVLKSSDPSYVALTAAPDHNFMFAVEVWKVNMTGPIRYFDVTLQQEVIQGLGSDVFTSIPLQECTREHWKDMPEVLDKFEQLGVANWLCPPIGLTLQLYGKYSSNVYSNYLITVSGCSNQTDPMRPCAPQQEIDALFDEFDDFFYFTFYYINPVINSDRKDFKSYYLQDENYVIFGRSVGAQAFVYFSDYKIETDSSIWPFENWDSDTGAFVEALSVNHPFQTVPNGKYAQICLAKSANSITYTRQVQKMSSVFSFIGGMIGAISAVFFFFKIYTNLALQISIAHSIFRADCKEDEAEETLSINLLSFMKYYAFSFMKLIGKPVGWTDCKYILKCQEEILKQLDIKLLIQRIIFIEHCLSFIFEDYELEGLQVKRPATPEQIREIRMKYEVSNHSPEIKMPERSEARSEHLMEELSASPPVLDNKISHNQEMDSPAFFDSKDKLPNIRSCTDPPPILVDDIISNSETDKEAKLPDIVFRPKPALRFSKNSVLPVAGLAEPLRIDSRRMSRLARLNREAREGREMSQKIWRALPTEAKIQVIEKESDLKLESIHA